MIQKLFIVLPWLLVNIALVSEVSAACAHRSLLAKGYRKAKLERKVAYEGKPLDVIRGVKNSHSCWVKCKKNSSCSRFTYIPGKWKKCELYRKGDRSVKKVKSKYTISGYASWRIKDKKWGKRKPKKPSKKGDKKESSKDTEEAYEAPGFNNFDGGEAYEDPGWTGGDVAYEDPGFDPSSPSGPYPPVSGPILDFTVMRGKTIFGRRVNSVLNCVGNIARVSSDCENMCRNKAECSSWTWASHDCSWVGDSKDTGVCYLMTNTDEYDVFEAPPDGNFVSGFVPISGFDQSGYGAYEAPGFSGSGAYEDPALF
jgi:hypothetical protein